VDFVFFLYRVLTGHRQNMQLLSYCEHPTVPSITKHMGIQAPPPAGFDLRLLALSGFVLIVATYATLALAGRIRSAQGVAWFAWLGGGASAMGLGIWSMHYLGLKVLGLPVLILSNSAVPFSILAAIFASGVTLLVVSGKSDSGRCAKGNEPSPSSHQVSTGSLLQAERICRWCLRRAI
jgi:hypothetical protein